MVFSNEITDPNPGLSNPFTAGQYHDSYLSVQGLGRGSGLSEFPGEDIYNAANFSTGIRDTSDYFRFFLKPAMGYRLRLDSFRFTGQRSLEGPSLYSFRSSVNQFNSSIGSILPTGGLVVLHTNIQYQNITDSIEFRIYGWSAYSASGTFGIKDFVFYGSVDQVPRITVSTLSAFPNTCTGTFSPSQPLTVSGINLTPDSVVAGPVDGYQFSMDNTVFSDSVVFFMPGFQSTTLYVRFAPSLVQGYTRLIPLRGGGASVTGVSVTGRGIGNRPSITDGTVSGVTVSGATLTYSVYYTGCSNILSTGIEYSTTPGFVNGTGTNLPASVIYQSAHTYSISLSGLGPPGQTYYVHTYVTNSGGVRYGAEISFTLLNDQPVFAIPLQGAGSLSGFGAVCVQQVSAANSFSLTGSQLDGSPVTVGPLDGFSFCATPAGVFTSTLTLVAGGAPYSYAGGNLTSCAIYVRFSPVLTSDYSGSIPITGGGAPDQSVPVQATGVNTIPGVLTSSATLITYNGATLRGSIPSVGCSPIGSYGFEYSTTAGFAAGSGTPVWASNLSPTRTFSFPLAGLLPSTVYYFRALASNAGGMGYGEISSFYTAPVPTQLLIQAVVPASPLALTPFQVQVTAVDNLQSRIPINVTEDTYIRLSRVAGLNVFTPPGDPAGMIPAGSHTVLITGNFYDASENNVGLSASAVFGMTSLTPSPSYVINIQPYIGSSEFVWSAPGGSVWLHGNLWNQGTAPGTTFLNTPNRDLAQFTGAASLDTSAGGGCGLDMAAVAGDLALGAIQFDTSYVGHHAGGVVRIGNASPNVAGVLGLNGRRVAHPMTSSTDSLTLWAAHLSADTGASVLEFTNRVGAGQSSLTLDLPGSGTWLVRPGNTIRLNLNITGTDTLHVAGGGVLELDTAASPLSHSGLFQVDAGLLRPRATQVFHAASPNPIRLHAQGPEPALFSLGGYDQTIGGLQSDTAGDFLNQVHNGNDSSVLTLQLTGAHSFAGRITDGDAGALALHIRGAGLQSLSGASSYTGETQLDGGTLQLQRPGGQTLANTSRVRIRNGMLRLSTDQILQDLSLEGGTLQVDSGAVLTITGNYSASAGAVLDNRGTIRLQGLSPQTFPGPAVRLNMNHLRIDNPAGVTLDDSLAVYGFLTLDRGSFHLQNQALTLYRPIQGHADSLKTTLNSIIEIAGDTSEVNLPLSVQQLRRFHISNTSGTVLSGDLFVHDRITMSALSGVVYVAEGARLRGTASLIMQGGDLMLATPGVVLPECTGTYQLSGGSVTLVGTGLGAQAQTVRPVDYFDLISLPTGGERRLSANGSIGIMNRFIPEGDFAEVEGSTMVFKKNTLQFVPPFTYYNLTLGGSGSSIKGLSGPVRVLNLLRIFSQAKLSLDQHSLTLRSDSVHTAGIAPLLGNNSILYNGSGRIIVERYIPSGLTHGKSWQFLSVPVREAHLFASWQESQASLQNNLPGFGTTVSGDRPGAVSRGFDFYTPAGGASLKYYDVADSAWKGLDDGVSTTAAIPISRPDGLMLFVRGDRSVQSFNTPATPVTLRTIGKLYAKGVMAPPPVPVPADQLRPVGNPYASAIDFEHLLGTSNGLDSVFYVWDPLLPGSFGYGGFQTLSQVNAFQPVPGGTANYPTGQSCTRIASGQAFFVRSQTGGTVLFDENNKIQQHAVPYRNSSTPALQLRMDLLDAQQRLIDGCLERAQDDGVAALDTRDAFKISYTGAGIGWLQAGRWLSIRSVPLPEATDTSFLSLRGVSATSYALRICLSGHSAGAYLPVLFDRLTGTETAIPLADTLIYAFTVSQGNLQMQEQRFLIRWRPAQPLPVRWSDWTLQELSDCTATLVWATDMQGDILTYTVQRSDAQGRFADIGLLAAQPGQVGRYWFQDTAFRNAVTGYRIRSLDRQGRETYTTILRAGACSTPNLYGPVQRVTAEGIHLDWPDFQFASCQSDLFSAGGARLLTLHHPMTASSTHMFIPWPAALSKGVYYLKISGLRNGPLLIPVIRP